MVAGQHRERVTLFTSWKRSWAAQPLRVKQFVLLLLALLVASTPGVYWAFQAATWLEQRDVAIAEQHAKPVTDGHADHGALIAEPETISASARYRSVMIPATLTVVLALAVAILLGIVLQRVIVAPVQSLSGTMGKVALTGDYTVRVPETRFDELGQLQVGFNRMIARVEELTARLEARVVERTLELDRANRELQRSNQDLDRFAYTVSHDLQEPLRNVTNIVHRLRSDWGQQLDPEIMKQIDAVDQQCDREMKMVQRILFISKLGRGGMQRQPVDLNQALGQILESMQTSLDERGVKLDVLPLPVVYGDAILLGEVLRNLVSNAAKYNDKPERRIRVVAREFPRHGTTLISVQDNGIGIRPQHLKKVFHLFTPLHDKRKFSETIGAGMAITRRIVERHHGRIRVVSTYGQGTSFFVRLPTLGVMRSDGTSSDSYRSSSDSYR
ncbi:MAG: ATP-binding protein [Planctomycetaceae bacterium]|nr:ATP-binding protein [Planctomycetaceae bacterium]